MELTLITSLTFRLNLLSSSEVRQPGKAPNYSVNWTVGCNQPEIIDAMKGKEQVTISPTFYEQLLRTKVFEELFVFTDWVCNLFGEKVLVKLTTGIEVLKLVVFMRACTFVCRLLKNSFSDI